MCLNINIVINIKIKYINKLIKLLYLIHTPFLINNISFVVTKLTTKIPINVPKKILIKYNLLRYIDNINKNKFNIKT